jgi:recombination protein RecR
MLKLPHTIEEAISALQQLPSVGRRTSIRYVLSMLRWTPQEMRAFAHAVEQLPALKTCNSCGVFIEESTPPVDHCPICLSDERKLQGALCVLEQFTDYVAIENAGFFKGHYHLLGGVLNPMLGVSARHLRIDSLLERLETGVYQKVILAINPSVEGDVTCAYLADVIKQRFSQISVERIGLGMPIGGHFEFLDPLTISASFSNKTIL